MDNDGFFKINRGRDLSTLSLNFVYMKRKVLLKILFVFINYQEK